MKKKKLVVGVCTCLCIAFVAIALGIIFKGDDKNKNDGTFEGAKETFQDDIQELKEGKYSNLVYNDFEAYIDDVEGVYNIEIQRDNSYKDRTFLENFEIMNGVIDKFFKEDFDKSFLVAMFNKVSEGDRVPYGDIEKVCVDEKYNDATDLGYLFGNEISNGGYMIQTSEKLINTWLARGNLGDTGPHGMNPTKVYPYITCINQNEDVEINLMDGKIKLSEMEKRVLDYIKNDFVLPVSEGVSFGIGDVRIVENGEYDGVCFKLRRIYKGIPFEYGNGTADGIYIDNIGHDAGEISYAYSEYPDTFMGFGNVDGTVVETKTITEMISLGDALSILSNEIGENSVYDVYGVELVYRNRPIPEEREDELDDILEPRWKIITLNQNDDKYTIFYVDVVTGELSERYEYYYE